MGSIFGGSKSKETASSYNQAYPGLQTQLGSTVGQTGQASSALAALLGLGGDQSAQRQAFDNFRDSTGYDFLLDSGRNAIMGNKASRGMFRSGSTGKALTNYGQQLGDTYYKDYINNLLGLGEMGLQSAGIVGGAGQRSESSRTSKSSPGLGGFLGGIASGIATGGL